MKTNYSTLFGKNPNNLISVKECGNFLEVTYCDSLNFSQKIQKIDSDFYVNLSDGSINKFNKTSVRSDNLDSVRKSVKNLRDLINCNTTIPQNVLFVTLTYAENMRDRKRLLKDFDVFYKRFRRFVSKEYGYYPKYICVPEPQERGAWHCHVLFIFNEKPKYIENDTIRKMWGQGFVSIKACDDVDNIGAYLSAYLMNTQGKKGGRLHLYPKGMRIFRCSQDIIRPVVCYKTITDITEMLQNEKYECTYYCTYETSLNDSFQNRIEKRFYKKIPRS